MSEWKSIVRACRRGDAAAWRELVRRTLPHVEACVRQVVSRLRTRIQPSLDDLVHAVYAAVRRDHGRLLMRLESESSWPVGLALSVRRVVHTAIGSVEGEIPTRVASEEASRAWKAYCEAPLDPWDRIVAGLFYFRGQRYRDIEGRFDEVAGSIAERVRRSAAQILGRYAPPAGDAPPPPRSPDCPTPVVLFDFVHREVTEESRRVLTEHVEACPACRAQCDRYRRLLMAMASIQPAAVSEPCLEDDDLIALAGRRVRPEDRERVGRHLAECADCWDALDYLSGVAAGDRPVPAEEIETPLAGRVLALGPPVPRPEGSGASQPRVPRVDRFRLRRRRVFRQIVRRQMLTWGGIGFAAVLALAMLVFALTGWPRRPSVPAAGAAAGPPKGPSADPAAPREAATGAIDLEDIRGPLRVRAGGFGQGIEVSKRASIAAGDELAAGDEGALFSLVGVRLGVRDGILRILQASGDEIRLEAVEGEFCFRISRDAPRVQLRCPHGRVETLERPGYPITMQVQVWRARTILVVHEGKARLKGDEGRVDIDKGAWSSVRMGEGPMGITRVDTPSVPAWFESRGDLGTPLPYFDLLAPVSERVPALLIAVPHATREPGAGRVAARMGRQLEAPVVLARWFEPADVIRPQETQWGSVPVPRPTPQARQIYDLYRSVILRASGAREFPLPYYIEVHGDELTGSAPVSSVEAITRGFERSDLERMRALWDRHPAHPPAVARVPLYVDILDPVIRSGGREILFAFGGYPGSFAQEPGGNPVRRALIFRLPRLVRLDPELARRYGEILADVVQEGMVKTK